MGKTAIYLHRFLDPSGRFCKIQKLSGLGLGATGSCVAY